MSEYVPTVPDVNGIRGSWACAHIRGDITPEQAIEAFNRWLASVKAEVLINAQQCIAGDLPVDEARVRGADLVSASGLIHDLDEMIASLIEEPTS